MTKAVHLLYFFQRGPHKQLEQPAERTRSHRAESTQGGRLRHPTGKWVLPIFMRSLSGIEAAREIRTAVPQVRIVFLTVHSESLFKLEALRAGASACVSKQAPDRLIGAIYAALERDTKDMEIIDDGSRAAASPIGRRCKSWRSQLFSALSRNL